MYMQWVQATSSCNFSTALPYNIVKTMLLVASEVFGRELIKGLGFINPVKGAHLTSNLEMLRDGLDQKNEILCPSNT